MCGCPREALGIYLLSQVWWIPLAALPIAWVAEVVEREVKRLRRRRAWRLAVSPTNRG